MRSSRWRRRTVEPLPLVLDAAEAGSEGRGILGRRPEHRPGSPLPVGGRACVDRGGQGLGAHPGAFRAAQDPGRAADDRPPVPVDGGGRPGRGDEHDVARLGPVGTGRSCLERQGVERLGRGQSAAGVLEDVGGRHHGNAAPGVGGQVCGAARQQPNCPLVQEAVQAHEGAAAPPLHDRVLVEDRLPVLTEQSGGLSGVEDRLARERDRPAGTHATVDEGPTAREEGARPRDPGEGVGVGSGVASVAQRQDQIRDERRDRGLVERAVGQVRHGDDPVTRGGSGRHGPQDPQGEGGARCGAGEPDGKAHHTAEPTRPEDISPDHLVLGVGQCVTEGGRRTRGRARSPRRPARAERVLRC